MQTTLDATLQNVLREKLQALGIHEFITEIAQPLSIAIGEKWEEGTINVFMEHFYTQQLDSLLNNFIINSELNSRENIPRVLLTTLSGEKHRLGLTMVQALLCAENVFCVNLGVEMPRSEIINAIAVYNINILGLSFSSAFPKRMMNSALLQLRSKIPAEIDLWIGGGGIQSFGEIPEGIKAILSPADITHELNDWVVLHK
jgi:methanogenic corrinoid protein MtbC1